MRWAAVAILATLAACAPGDQPTAPTAEADGMIAVHCYAPPTAGVPTDYVWTAPTTGSPAVGYIVEHRIMGGEWRFVCRVRRRRVTLGLEIGYTHQVRVAAYDREGRVGEYSIPSEAYTPRLELRAEPGATS